MPLPREEMDRYRGEFAARFGEGETPALYFAPGRVNIIGEHTDYNGGYVLPIALEQGTYILIRPREGPPSRIFSTSVGKEVSLDLRNLRPGSDWCDYVRGVLHLLGKGRRLPDFDALIFGDLPLEAGLSSSASLEVAVASAAASLGVELAPEEAAALAWRAENEFVGVPCGVMDQYASALGRAGTALLLNCSTLEYRYVPCDLSPAVFLVAHTGVSRSLAGSEYRRRRRECGEALRLLSQLLGRRDTLSAVSVEELERAKGRIPETLRRRAEHVIWENRRVLEAVNRLEERDHEGLGRLLNLSHASLRDLYRVSSPELDALQELSLAQPGVYGCRMTGAGFGGCAIVLLEEECLPRYLEKVPALYRKATGRQPFFLPVRPSGGACRLE